MKCPQCQVEWTPPPAVCPRCRIPVATLPPRPIMLPTVPPPPPIPNVVIAPPAPVIEGITPATIPLLQQAAEHSAMDVPSRSTATISILFGIIAMLAGISGLQYTDLNIVLVLIGIFLIIEGIWILLTKPSVATFIVDGIALLMVGVWNISVFLISLSVEGGRPSIFFFILGFFQVMWGIRRFTDAGKFSAMQRTSPPNPAALALVEKIAEHIRDAEIMNNEQIIEFETKTFSEHRKWKAELGDRYFVSFEMRLANMRFLHPHEFTITTRKKILLRDAYHATFRFNSDELHGKISRRDYERYTQWKTRTPQSASITLV